MGALEKELGHVGEAEKDFRRALSISPHNVDALTSLGDSLRWHDEKQAKVVLGQAVMNDPDDTFCATLLEILENKLH